MPCTHKYSITDLTNPKLEDLLIKRLRAKLSGITWVTYIMPRIVRKKDADGKEWPFIANYTDRNEIMVTPDSDLKGLIFFEVREAAYADSRGLKSRYDVSLYGWLNMPKISATKEDITTNCIAHVIGLLFKSSYVEQSSIRAEMNMDEVFNFDGLQDPENLSKYVMGKYRGFRLDFTCYQDDCFEVYTPTAPAVPGC